jgi:hypothetical protein
MLSPKKGEGRRVVPNGESACLANTRFWVQSSLLLLLLLLLLLTTIIK